MSDRVSAAAVGAVFTHPDHRGMGYGATVTAAVVHELMGRVDTIGLNCTDANTRAIRIYEQMGFEAKLGYDECELR
jgi:predicted GNAT family acetyltransferase